MSDKPGKIVPPFWAGIYLAAGLAGHYVWLANGRGRWDAAGWGISVSALGFTLMFWAWKLFHLKGTAVCPFEESTHLITEGPYRFTRNPMYLGMTVLLLGIAVAAGTPPTLFAPLAFFLTVNFLFIPYEEKKMERIFSRPYLEYRRRVRRWV